MLKLKIVPHVGIQNTIAGPVEVDVGQWQIFASTDGSEPNVRIGYLGYQANSHIQPIADLPEEMWQEVVKQCEEFRKGAVNGVADFSHVRAAMKLTEEAEETDGQE